MYWHVQHDDHVYSGDQFMLLANDETHAKQIVDRHNAEIDRLAGEIRRLYAGYSGCGMMDAARLQLLEHFKGFIKRERTEQQDLQTALDCLTSYLLDHTETVFQEDEEIDAARFAVQQRIEEHSKGNV